MASVYILHSKKLNRFYIGSCKDLSYRINQHLNKEFIEGFTAKAEDWELYLSIDELAYQQARSIEMHLKKMKSKIYIKNLKKYPEIIDRLKNEIQLMAAPIAIGAVDALVSNTNGCKAVPVRPDSYRDRLWVRKKLQIF